MQSALKNLFRTQVLVVTALVLVLLEPSTYSIAAAATTDKEANGSGISSTAVIIVGTVAGVVALAVGIGGFIYQRRLGRTDEQSFTLRDRSVRDQAVLQWKKYTRGYDGGNTAVNTTQPSSELPCTSPNQLKHNSDGFWPPQQHWVNPTEDKSHGSLRKMEVDQESELETVVFNQIPGRLQDHRGRKISIDVGRGFDTANIEAPGVTGELSPTLLSYDMADNSLSQIPESGPISPTQLAISTYFGDSNGQYNTDDAEKSPPMPRWTDETLPDGYDDERDSDLESDQVVDIDIDHVIATPQIRVHRFAGRRPLRNLPPLPVRSKNRSPPVRKKNSNLSLPSLDSRSSSASATYKTLPTGQVVSQSTYQLEQGRPLPRLEGESDSGSSNESVEGSPKTSGDRGSYRVW